MSGFSPVCMGTVRFMEDWADRLNMVAGMRGISIAELARRTGASYERVIKCAQGKVAQPRGTLMADMARELGVRLAWLRYGEEPMEPEGAPEDSTLRYLKSSAIAGAHKTDTPAPATEGWPRDLPVSGTHPAGGNGAMTLSEDPVELVRRPPGLQSVPDAYGFYVLDDTMAPRYPSGELCLVHPHRPPRPGDDVVIKLTATADEPPIAYLRRFLRQTADEIVCAQFDPPRETSFPRERIASIHKVMPLHELLGF